MPHDAYDKLWDYYEANKAPAEPTWNQITTAIMATHDRPTLVLWQYEDTLESMREKTRGKLSNVIVEGHKLDTLLLPYFGKLLGDGSETVPDSGSGGATGLVDKLKVAYLDYLTKNAPSSIPRPITVDTVVEVGGAPYYPSWTRIVNEAVIPTEAASMSPQELLQWTEKARGYHWAWDGRFARFSTVNNVIDDLLRRMSG